MLRRGEQLLSPMRLNGTGTNFAKGGFLTPSMPDPPERATGESRLAASDHKVEIIVVAAKAWGGRECE